MLVNLYSMAQQGRWLGWETAMQLDTRWNKLPYAWSPELLKFYLNSVQDTLPSPENLKTWSKHSLGLCSQCGYNNCTMIHIFNCCQYSLKAGRYNWRHDMVLRKIVHHKVPVIHRAREFTEDNSEGYQSQEWHSRPTKELNTTMWNGRIRREARDCRNVRTGRWFGMKIRVLRCFHL